jgi:hypothetical protein
MGGAGGGGPKLDASAGLGGAGPGMGGASGIGGNAGAGMEVDGSTKDAPADVKDAAADLALDTTAPLLANGSSCQTGAACQSGRCVDSFCCDSDCTGQCQSCGESSSPGKCVTISGAVRGQLRPTCAGSGACAATCNGIDPGQCHFPGSEKPCASATCTVGIAKAAASCDGLGNCPSGSTSNCDPFICGATACKTTCTTSADCTSTSYCAAPNCVAKKGLGAACGAGEQCATGICGGRCCSAPCTCPQPSPGNLFANPGFDSSVTLWDPIKAFSTGSTGVQWSSDDADGCPFSGSIQEISSGLGNPSQCVAVTAGANYTLGLSIRSLDGSGGACQIYFWSGINCTGTMTFGMALGAGETTWTFHSTPPFSVPIGNVSLSIVCEANTNTFFDKLFLSTTGAY